MGGVRVLTLTLTLPPTPLLPLALALALALTLRCMLCVPHTHSSTMSSAAWMMNWLRCEVSSRCVGARVRVRVRVSVAGAPLRCARGRALA